MNYQNGRIYKIVSDLTDLIYIGSTCSPLSKRHYEHKSLFKTGTNKCKSIELIKLGETRIELIENYPCESKEQLNAREGYYIKLYKDICVNKCIAGRTQKQYDEANKEKITEYKKKWYEANKDKIREHGKEYREANKDKIREHVKEYRKLNKDKKAEYDKKRYEAKKAIKLQQ